MKLCFKVKLSALFTGTHIQIINTIKTHLKCDIIDSLRYEQLKIKDNTHK